MGTRFPFPLPRAAASKNRLLSSSAAFAATALLLITELACGVTAEHFTPIVPLLLLLRLADTTVPVLTRAPAAGTAVREGENTEVAARDSIAAGYTLPTVHRLIYIYIS
jgi:hypothetical protein